jgi:hypothetical protein
MPVSEFLSGQVHQGISNILLNIILLLIVNIETDKQEKIIVYFQERRHDFFLNFCDKISNEKLEIKNYKEYNENKNLPTLKSNTKYLYSKLAEIMQKKDNHDLFTNFKFGYTYVKKDIIKNSLKYFPFKVNNFIQKKIDCIQKNMGKYIAVHIRATDFPEYQKYVKKKKTEEYFARYYNFISNFEEYKVYLSTDSYEVQQFFNRKYNDRVFYYQEISNDLLYKKRYVSGESVYIDYICCRDAEYFMPTKNSTFSHFIQLLRFINYEDSSNN